MNTEKNKKKWVEKVMTTLSLGNRSDATKKNYKYAIQRYLNFYSEDKNVQKMSEEEIQAYFIEVYLNLKKAASTYNGNLSAIKYLYNVCFKRSLSCFLLPPRKVKNALPEIITKEEFLLVFNTEKDLKKKCWLLLSFCCGLRACEVASIRIEWIFSKENKLKVLGKGNKERFTILPDIVIKFLRLFYKKAGLTKKSGYLFEGSKGREHTSPATISNYFTNFMKQFDFHKHITEHTLRHSFATYMIMNGMELITLQKILGHSSIKTTTIYIHLALDFKNLKGVNYAK